MYCRYHEGVVQVLHGFCCLKPETTESGSFQMIFVQKFYNKFIITSFVVFLRNYLFSSATNFPEMLKIVGVSISAEDKFRKRHQNFSRLQALRFVINFGLFVQYYFSTLLKNPAITGINNKWPQILCFVSCSLECGQPWTVYPKTKISEKSESKHFSTPENPSHYEAITTQPSERRNDVVGSLVCWQLL